MNILSKNSVRTIAVGVVVLSISSLGSWAFAAPAPTACTNGYMQVATVSGDNLSRALDACYVNRPAQANTTNCVQNAFQAHYKALLAAINNFQSCSAVPPSQ